MRLNAIVVLAAVALSTACQPALGTGGTGSGEPSALADPAGVQSEQTSGTTGRIGVREVRVPAGTRLQLVMETPVASDTSRVEQPIAATLSEPVTVDSTTVFPAGSRVTGQVTDAVRSGKVKGRAQIALRFDGISRPDEDARYSIETQPFARTAPSEKDKDALKIIAPAAGGAVVGRIVGGKKGAAIGTAAGGAAGTAVVLSTRGKEVRLARGAAVTLRLSEPLVVRVPAI